MALLLAGCSGNGQPSGSATDAANVFFLSNQPPQNNGQGLPAWCRGEFPTPVVLNADPNDFNKRIFNFGNGPYKVTVHMGNFVAAFVLQRVGKQVEIFTSRNFPECLSNSNNFIIQPGTNSFRYDNQKEIRFSVELTNGTSSPMIVIDMGKDAPYGIEVRR